MDDRFRFLYCPAAELRGRMGKARPENGRLRASAAPGGKENPPAIRGGRDADRTGSREARGSRAEKSRYGLQGTRTANRHRWMRRES